MAYPSRATHNPTSNRTCPPCRKAPALRLHTLASVLPAAAESILQRVQSYPPRRNRLFACFYLCLAPIQRAVVSFQGAGASEGPLANASTEQRLLGLGVPRATHAGQPLAQRGCCAAEPGGDGNMTLRHDRGQGLRRRRQRRRCYRQDKRRYGVDTMGGWRHGVITPRLMPHVLTLVVGGSRRLFKNKWEMGGEGRQERATQSVEWDTSAGNQTASQVHHCTEVCGRYLKRQHLERRSWNPETLFICTCPSLGSSVCRLRPPKQRAHPENTMSSSTGQWQWQRSSRRGLTTPPYY